MEKVNTISLADAFLAVWTMHGHNHVPRNFLEWYGTKFKTPIEGELLDQIIEELVAQGDVEICPNGTYFSRAM